MTSKLRKKFSLRKSTPDLSEWGKHDAKLIESLNKNDVNKINQILTKKSISPTKLDPSGQTVFHRAAAEGKVGAVQIFLKHKADVNCRDINDRTPLHAAAGKGHIDCMKLLLNNGASPLSEEKDRQTPLHHAAAGGHIEAMKILMRSSNEPLNASDMQGRTPLFMATIGGHILACDELLQMGANVNHQDINNRTPLMLVAEKGNSGLAELLVRHGANPIIQDKKGHNAMWYAANSSKSNMEQYLRNIPSNTAWNVHGKTPAAKKPVIDSKRSSESGRSQNGDHDNSIDMDTAMFPVSDDDSSSDEEGGYLVPIDIHPETSKRPQIPVGVETVQATSPRERFDEKAYREKVRAEIVGDYENELRNLQSQLVSEKKKSQSLDEKIKLLQMQMDKIEPKGRKASTSSSSDKDLRELSAFGDIQEAHEKEVIALNREIQALREQIDDYCDDNKTLKEQHHTELANRAKMEEDLSRLRDHISDLRVNTTALPIDIDMEELLKNRIVIDKELRQVQEILEQLKMTTPGGPIDSSLFHEIERLREENADLRASNNDLKKTVSSVQSQIASFQELASINDKLMKDNNKLKRELDMVIDDLRIAKNRKPVIIDGPDNLLKHNTELAEENDRVKNENAKLLRQLAAIQNDIENTMSKLPSIDEFVATKQENDRMRTALARHVDALQNAAVEKEDMKQRIEDLRVMNAAMKSGPGNCEEHRKTITALREMVERLKEQNDILELEKLNPTDTISPVHVVPVASAHAAEFPHLQTENRALREMIERQQQQLQHLDLNNKREIEALVAKNKGLETMVANLSNELSTQKPRSRSDSSSSDDSVKKKPQISNEVRVLNAVPVKGSPSSTLETENAKLRAEIARMENIISQTSLMGNEDTTAMKNENMALREMVIRLKENNEILSEQINDATKKSDSSSSDDEDIVMGKPKADMKEVIALREMVSRLTEQNDILEAQAAHPVSTHSDDEVKGLRGMLTKLQDENSRLKNDIEHLNVQLMAQRRRSGSSISSATSKDGEQEKEQIKPTVVNVVHAGLQQASPTYDDRELIALREMVARLAEQNEILENQMIKPQTTAVLHSAPSGRNNEHLERENAALKEMLVRLREQNDIMEQENLQKQPIIMEQVASQKLSRQSSTSSASGVNNEVIALREMVERLKEQITILERENDKPKMTEVPPGLMAAASQDLSDLHKQNVALKEMVERLREQNFILEQATPRGDVDMAMHADVVKENQALKAMLAKMERSRSSSSSHSDDEEKQVQIVQQHATPVAHAAPGRVDDDLQRQNIALREMNARMREQIEILEQYKDIARPQVGDPDIQVVGHINTVPLQTTPIKSSTKDHSESSDSDESDAGSSKLSMRKRPSQKSLDNANKEIIALREMNATMKEQIEILEQYKDIGKPQVGDPDGMVQETIHVQSTPTLQSKMDRRDSSSSSDSVKSSKKSMGDPGKELLALREMVERLREQIYILEQQQERPVMHVPVAVDDMKQNIALLEMVERLKEEICILEQYKDIGNPQVGDGAVLVQQQVVQAQAAPTVHAARVMKGSSDSSDNDDVERKKKTVDYPDLRNENIALREMVERLREHVSILEQQKEAPVVNVPSIDRSPRSRASSSSNSDHIEPLNEREVIALREMVLRLKEQIDIYEQYKDIGLPQVGDKDVSGHSDVQKSSAPNVQANQPRNQNDFERENLAMREMIQRLKEQIDIYEQYKDIGLPQVGDIDKPVHEVTLVQAVPVVHAARKSSVSSDSGDERNDGQIMKARIIELEKENNNLKIQMHDLRKPVQTLGLESENIALKEMIIRLKENIDIAYAERPAAAGDYEELQRKYQTLLDALSKQKRTSNSDSSDDDNAHENRRRPRKTARAERQDSASSSDRERVIQQVKIPTVAASAQIAEPDKQIIALKAMVASQKERIEILEAQLSRSSKKMNLTEVWSNDDEKIKMRGEIERLDLKLSEAMKLNKMVGQDPTIAELREMVKNLNERNILLEEQVQQVMKVNKDVGRLMAANEQLGARNKALEVMIKQLSGELTADHVDSSSSDSESAIKPQQIKLVETAPVMSAHVTDDIDILGLKREKDALKEMVKSLGERVEILERELDAERDKPQTPIVVPVSQDLEIDNMKLRERIATLEGLLDEARNRKIEVDNHEEKVKNNALLQMVESQRERIDILEQELNEKPVKVERILEVTQEPIQMVQATPVHASHAKHDSVSSESGDDDESKHELDTLRILVENQKAHIIQLETQLSGKPKEIVVRDSRVEAAAEQIIGRQKEHIEALEAELDQKPKEIVREDTRSVIALTEIVSSQKERIEVLENEIVIQPKERIIEIKDTKENEALQQVVESQREQIEILHLELDQKPKETIVEIKDTKLCDAQAEVITRQRENIEALESELDQKPKEVIVEVENFAARKALEDQIENLTKKILDLQRELEQKPKIVDNTKTVDALEEMVKSQKEQIDILEKQLDAISPVVEEEREIPSMQTSQKVVALEQMLDSLKEQNDILIKTQFLDDVRAEQIKSQIVIDELESKNKAFEAMVAQLTDELTKQKRSDDSDSDHEILVQPQHITVVHAAPVQAATKERKDSSDSEGPSVSRDGLLREIEGLKVMINSQTERIKQLERERDEKPDYSVVDENNKLRLNIAKLEAMLTELNRTGDENIALREMIEQQKERIEILEENIQSLPVRQMSISSDSDDDKPSKTKFVKENDALKAMVDSQRERIEILEIELQLKPIRRVSVSSDSGDEKSQTKVNKENEALKAMVDSQKERIEILEKEFQHTPIRRVSVSSDSGDEKSKTKINKENEALKAMVDSQKERIEILEREDLLRPKITMLNEIPIHVQTVHSVQAAAPEKYSSSDSDDVLKPSRNFRDNSLAKENEALKAMLHSQAERIEILETEGEPNLSSQVTVDKREAIALKEIVDRQKEHIEILESEKKDSSHKLYSSDSDDGKKDMTVTRKKRADLRKENDALKAMLASQAERIELLEKERYDLLNAGQVPIQIIKKTSDDSSSDSDGETKRSLKKKRSDLLRENEALKAMVASQTERIEILEKEKDVLPRLQPEEVHVVTTVPSQSKPTRSSSQGSSSDSDSGKGHVTRKRRDDILEDDKALRLMVDSQSAKILEKERGLDVLQTENAALRNEREHLAGLLAKSTVDEKQNQAMKAMLESQQERIEILEKEAESFPGTIGAAKRVRSVSSDSDSDREHDPTLKEAQAIVQLNKENVALKEMITSLIEQLDHDGALDKVEPYSTSDLKERNDHLSTINQELQNQMEEYEDIARLAEEIQREKNTLQEENNAINEEIFRLRQMASFADDLKRERDHAIDDRIRMQEELDNLKKVLLDGEQVEQDKYKWADQQAELNSEILGLKKTMDEQTKLLDGSEKYTASLQDDNREMKVKLNYLEDELTKYKNHLERKENLQSKVDELSRLLEVKDGEIKLQAERVKESHNALLKAKDELNDKQKTIMTNEADREKLMEDNERLVEQNYELRAEMENLQKAATEAFTPKEKKHLEEEIYKLKRLLEDTKVQNENRRHKKVRSDSESSHSDPDEIIKVEDVKLVQSGVKHDDNEHLRREKIALEQMISALKEEKQGLHASKQETVNLLPSLNEEMQLHNEELQDENDQLKQNIAHLQKRLDKASDEIDVLTEHNRQLEEELGKKIYERQAAKRKDDSSDSEGENAKQLQKENEQLKKDIEHLRKTIDTLNLSLQEAEERAKPPPIPVTPIPEESAIQVFKLPRPVSTDSAPTSPRDLHAENLALKAMVESLKEQIVVLQGERGINESPELDRLTTENKILRADVDHLEVKLRTSNVHQDEINRLKKQLHEYESRKNRLQSGSSDSDGDSDSGSNKTKTLYRELENLHKEKADLQEHNRNLSEQIAEMRSDFDNKSKKLQKEIEDMREENGRLKSFMNAGEELKPTHQTVMHAALGEKPTSQERAIEDLSNKTFEKVQMVGELDLMKDKLAQIQKELDNKEKEAAYLQTENSELRAIIGVIQETTKIPPDELIAKMKSENHKLQTFINQLNEKVDRILSPRDVVAPQTQAEREKLSMENQMHLLQKQVERLVNNLNEERRKHKEVISTYRTHLLAAVQGNMDPEVKQALLHISRLRSSAPVSRDASFASQPLPGIDAPHSITS